MAAKPLPCPTVLRQLLRYDPETGKLFWRSNQSRKCRAGSQAFTSMGSHGYFQGGVGGEKYLAHRVIWAMHAGEWPVEIDHINGDRSDNRLSNLRNVTRSGNMKNQRLSTANTSGFIGVSRFKRDNKWQAKIMVARKCIFLGLFDTPEAAVAARKAAELKYGFHENHGRTA